MALSYYGNGEMWIQTNSFNLLSIISIVAISISLISLVIYYETVKNKEKNIDNETQNFAWKDLKSYSLRYYLLSALQFFYCGGSWIFQFMFMQFLEIRCGISYLNAKNLIVAVPVLNLLAIGFTTWVCHVIKNETKAILASSILN